MKKHTDIEKIDELFRNTLENAEFEVPGSAWNAIESGIESQAHVAGQAGGALAKATLFKGAALLVAAGIAVGSYFYLTNPNKIKENAPLINQDQPGKIGNDSVEQDHSKVVLTDPAKVDQANDQIIIVPDNAGKGDQGETGKLKLKDGNHSDGLKDIQVSPGKEVTAEDPKEKNNSDKLAAGKEEGSKSSFWFALSDTVICLGDAVVVTSYQDMKAVKWFIDGQQYYPTTSSFSLRFDRGGFFDLTMQADDKKFSRTIYVEQVNAAFKVTYLDKGRFRLVSTSKAAKTCEWDFGDGTAVQRGATVEHSFPKSSTVANYKVTLTARGKSNCSDTFSTEVQNRYTGRQFGAPVVPNAFSPNGDGMNERLELTWDGDGPCVIVITDMKGFRVWESKDAVNQFWDGSNINTGKLCPQGQYFATISYRDQNGTVKTMNVLVTLLQ